MNWPVFLATVAFSTGFIALELLLEWGLKGHPSALKKGVTIGLTALAILTGATAAGLAL